VDSRSARLVSVLHSETCLAEADFGWQFGQGYELQLQVVGSTLTGLIDGRTVVEATLRDNALMAEGSGLSAKKAG
jgi:hypothetical protein